MEREKEQQEKNMPNSVAAYPPEMPQPQQPTQQPTQQPVLTDDYVISQLATFSIHPTRVIANIDLIAQRLEGADPINSAVLDQFFQYIVRVVRSSMKIQVKVAALDNVENLLQRADNDGLPPHWTKTILELVISEEEFIISEYLLYHLRYLAYLSDSHREQILGLNGLSILAKLVSRDRNLLGEASLVVGGFCNYPEKLSSQQFGLVLQILTQVLRHPNSEWSYLENSCMGIAKLCYDDSVIDSARIFPEDLLARVIEMCCSPQTELVAAAFSFADRLIAKSHKYALKLFELGIMEHAEKTILSLWDEFTINACCGLLQHYCFGIQSKAPGISKSVREKLNNTPLVERLKELLSLGGRYSYSIMMLFCDMLSVQALRHFAMDDLLFSWVVEKLGHDDAEEIKIPMFFIKLMINTFKEEGKSDTVVYELNRHGCLQQLLKLSKNSTVQVMRVAGNLLTLAHDQIK